MFKAFFSAHVDRRLREKRKARGGASVRGTPNLSAKFESVSGRHTRGTMIAQHSARVRQSSGGCRCGSMFLHPGRSCRRLI